jgi:hypothetical protein
MEKGLRRHQPVSRPFPAVALLLQAPGRRFSKREASFSGEAPTHGASLQGKSQALAPLQERATGFSAPLRRIANARRGEGPEKRPEMRRAS